MDTLSFQQIHPEAKLPSRGSDFAVGLDLHSVDTVRLNPGAREAVRTGLAVAIPDGFYGRIAPRSGLAFKHGLDVLAGVIDPDYRGEIKCLVINLGREELKINSGDRLAQLIVEKAAILEPIWESKLPETNRNEDGFGSTGK